MISKCMRNKGKIQGKGFVLNIVYVRLVPPSVLTVLPWLMQNFGSCVYKTQDVKDSGQDVHCFVYIYSWGGEDVLIWDFQVDKRRVLFIYIFGGRGDVLIWDSQVDKRRVEEGNISG